MGSDSYRPIRKHHRNASQGSLGSIVDQQNLVPILSASVCQVSTVKEGATSKSYAVYKILVRSRDARGTGQEEHSVYRRFSDFYALQDKVRGNASI